MAEDCRSVEAAAEAYFEAISAFENGPYEFRQERFSDELTGFQIFDRSGQPAGAMVIENTSCKLRLFDDLAIE